MSRFTAEVTPDAENIALLTERVADFLRGAGVDGRAIHHVALVIDELLANTASHGRRPTAPATVLIEVNSDQVAGEIGDWGEPFDPRTASAVDIAVPAEDRKIGGLGLHLVRELTSALDYRNDGRQNWTRFCVPRGQDLKK
jgi:anti-sigma regulatory factor (Ser/Thr protein kinase)